jgi:hypothetical protein
MFDELCRSGRIHELAVIHRFRHDWEQRASLQLRAANRDALDAYFHHRRIEAGAFDDVTDDIARRWIDQSAGGRDVAVVAETNEHVDALNAAIQQARRQAGQIGHREVRVAGGETAAVGDQVVTRRNDRALRTDRGEPVRNRDRWTVTAVHPDGGLTVSHAGGHGTVTLPADYTASHVRLGYAATAHGHQGDTVDVSLAVVTEATSHRSLYVAATRGRDENRLFVVAEEPDQARDVLERVLANDRADLPAVAQRRNLARQVPRTRVAEEEVAAAWRALDQARRQAEPALRPLRTAEKQLRAAEQQLRERQRAFDDAPWWRRRAMTALVRDASDAVERARTKLDDHERAAAPHTARIASVQDRLRDAEHHAGVARLSDRLDRLHLETPSRTIERGVGIEPPGLGR